MATASTLPLLTHTTGVVLAGGKSARMGASKAALPIGGEPLLRRVVGRLAVGFAEVLVVGDPELAALAPGITVVPDRVAGAGPLAGLEAALSALATPRAFVVACDMPFVSPALARHLADLAAERQDADVVALRTSRGLEPLHAVYAAACLHDVRRQLHDGQRSLQHLLARLRVLEVTGEGAGAFDPTGLSVLNANTPDEWREVLDLAARGP